MRRDGRRDAIEPACVAALKSSGFDWEPAKDQPFDGIVFRQGGRQFVIFEFKSKGGKPTDRQDRFWERSAGLPRFYIHSPEEAVRVAQQWC